MKKKKKKNINIYDIHTTGKRIITQAIAQDLSPSKCGRSR